jgi:argininosuccinate lyase
VTLWAARTETDLAPEVAGFLRADDGELLPYDCEATLVHARRLHAAGLLSDSEVREVEARLVAIREEGHLFVATDEDIHSTLERLLGPVGKKIHAGRSRNDQVAAALRLYVADACAEAREGVAELAETTLDLAEREADTLFPGYTHLQRAQPVTLGHHLLAWVEMLERDLARFAHAAEQAGPSPLGAGALAGSTLPLPAPQGPQARNSLDAVADRDFALDYLYACAVLLGHLSRIGEEIVVWCTSEFGFVRLPEDAATGSSAMPQKLNPDVAELVRGKAGTAIGRLAGLLAVVKGLPLAYNRDLQEDKTPVFTARRDVRGALGALTVLVGGLEVEHERVAEAGSDPALLATDAAEELVREGMPFRDAYERVAGAVRSGELAAEGGAEESVAARGAPWPGGGHDARAAARARFATI